MVHTVLHADDTPHSIALGAAIGTFVAFLPLIGIQMIVSVALAALLRANKAICIPIVWITNPLTAVPIYGPCLLLGHFVLGLGKPDAAVLNELTAPVEGASWFEVGFWTNLFSRFINLGQELWVGCTIVATVLALLSYPLTRWAVVSYRERRRHRILRRSLLRVHDTSSTAAGRREAV